MAKTDLLDSEFAPFSQEEVEYKQNLSSDLFKKAGKNLNYLCSLLGNFHFIELTGSSGTWTAPSNSVRGLVVFGFGGSGGGGGGGLKLGTPGSGVGTSGNSGSDTIFSGSIVAKGGSGGPGGGGNADFILADDEADITPDCSEESFSIKGKVSPDGGQGGRPSDAVLSTGRPGYYNNAGGGGENGNFGVRFISNVTPGSSHSYSIGQGGAGGTNLSNGSTYIGPTAGSFGSLFILCWGE